MAMTYNAIDTDGRLIQKQLFPTIGESTETYTHLSDQGLLSTTHFTQPALIIMERAIVADLKARQLVSPTSCFAGHSLGEYAALICLAEIMPLETALSTVFYRGLMMQSTVERDEHAKSEFAMVACNPSRVCEGTTSRTGLVYGRADRC